MSRKFLVTLLFEYLRSNGKVDVLSQEVIEATLGLMQSILDGENFELVDIEYVKEKNQWFLRLFIDKEGGIDIEDTALISEKLSQKMDETVSNPFSEVDFLEVSSPGVERPLKKDSDFEAAIGQYIHVFLYQSVDKVKIFEGELLSFDVDTLTLSIQEKAHIEEKTLERKNIAKVRLAVKV